MANYTRPENIWNEGALLGPATNRYFWPPMIYPDDYPLLFHSLVPFFLRGTRGSDGFWANHDLPWHLCMLRLGVIDTCRTLRASWRILEVPPSLVFQLFKFASLRFVPSRPSYHELISKDNKDKTTTTLGNKKKCKWNVISKGIKWINEKKNSVACWT